MTADGNPDVQLVLPLAETLGWLRTGVGELIRQAGLQVMELMMEEEVGVDELIRLREEADRSKSRRPLVPEGRLAGKGE